MNRLFLKLRLKTAQHSVEYMTVIILIMAGIIIGGPYVIRSWNAQMKGWDDSVTDSLQDTIEEAPLFPVQGCDSTPWSDGGCGANRINQCNGAITTCDVLEKLWYQNYNPDGCQCNIMFPVPVTIKCTADPSCCMPWSPAPPNPVTDCGVNATPPCADGEARQTRICGGSITETRCAFDPLCVFSCTGVFGPNTLPEYGDLCAGDNTGLSSGTNYTYVNPGVGNCTATKCEIQCNPTYVSYGTYCGT